MTHSDTFSLKLRARIAGIAHQYSQELRFDLIEHHIDEMLEWANASDRNNAVYVNEVLNAIVDPSINFPELARYSLDRLLRNDLRIRLADELSKDQGERASAVIRSILRADS